MISDAELKAYLDGALPEDRTAAVEAALNDPAMDARLRALDPMAGPVAEAFAAVRPPARPAVEAPRVPWAALAASVALVAGIGIGWTLAPKPTSGWVAAVADYQVLYKPETVAALQPSQADLEAQLAAAGQAVGADLSPFAVARIRDAPLRRAQVLGLGDRKIVQMVYQMPDGTPLALCLTVRGDGAAEAMALELRGLEASRWQTADLDILLIGDTGPAAMADLARAARQITTRL